MSLLAVTRTECLIFIGQLNMTPLTQGFTRSTDELEPWHRGPCGGRQSAIVTAQSRHHETPPVG
jgi:hypothetical protein